MSDQRPAGQPAEDGGEGHGTVAVCSEVAADGTYVLTISASEDSAIILDRSAAMEHAMGVMTIAMRAAHDAAVAAQLRAAGSTLEQAAEVVQLLRADRQPINTSAFTLVPGVSVFTGKAFLEVWVPRRRRGQPPSIRAGQWTIADAFDHAAHVLAVAAAVDLDTTYHYVMTKHVGLADRQARGLVDALGNHLKLPDYPSEENA